MMYNTILVLLVVMIVGPIGLYCESKAGSGVKVTLGLPTKKNRYVRMRDTLPELMEFTICIWFKPYKVDGLVHLISYSSRKEPDSIRIWYKCQEGKNCGIGMNVAGDKLSAKVDDQKSVIKNFTWIHACFGWNSWTYDGYIHLNGDNSLSLSKTSKDLRKMSELKIETGGVLVLGQDQDVYAGGFDAKEAFAGEMYDLQIWNEKINEHLATLIGKCGQNYKGDVVSWIRNAMELRDVFVQKFNYCRQ